jgi:formylmethanofuran dehydrogenase subunit E
VKVKDLQKYLETLDPEENIWYLIYDKSSVADHYATPRAKFEATPDEWEDIYANFELRDYTWESISEDFGATCSEFVKEFACNDCGELDRQSKVLNTKTLCSDCGEAKEVIY